MGILKLLFSFFRTKIVKPTPLYIEQKEHFVPDVPILTQEDVATIFEDRPGKMSPEDQAAQEALISTMAEIQEYVESHEPEPEFLPEPETPKPNKARELYDNWVQAKLSRKMEAYAELRAYKKTAKKSWKFLGFSEEEVKKIIG